MQTLHNFGHMIFNFFSFLSFFFFFYHECNNIIFHVIRGIYNLIIKKGLMQDYEHGFEKTKYQSKRQRTQICCNGFEKTKGGRIYHNNIEKEVRLNSPIKGHEV